MPIGLDPKISPTSEPPNLNIVEIVMFFHVNIGVGNPNSVGVVLGRLLGRKPAETTDIGVIRVFPHPLLA
jgi:hypothetical protein